MFRSCTVLGGLVLLGVAACSSQDPSADAFAHAHGGGPATPHASSSADAGAHQAPTPPASPPSTPPPPIATDASAGGTPADAAPPPAPPSGSCANPKCGATTDGCGCAASNGQGDVVFLGCNTQGCVCGHGQTVDEQLDVTTACDSDADMLAAWQMCTCP